jgi:TATA-box binding protein (TBP) (component of TFIID and TFIIIB)
MNKIWSLTKERLNLKNDECKPEQFQTLIYKIQKPKALFLLLCNGQIICTATKNLEIVEETMKKLKDKLILRIV